jgi:hypothetical protein
LERTKSPVKLTTSSNLSNSRQIKIPLQDQSLLLTQTSSPPQSPRRLLSPTRIPIQHYPNKIITSELPSATTHRSNIRTNNNVMIAQPLKNLPISVRQQATTTSAVSPYNSRTSITYQLSGSSHQDLPLKPRMTNA